ncbi:MAG: hypothetical protein KJO45_06250, partial [Sulfurovum sp.]|nr:hypothetical protein [Sulfurovum sp.]
MKLVKLGLTTLLATSFILAETKSISLSTDKVNPPKDILAAAEKLLNKTKVVNGMTVADKGNNPGKYFDGGIV